MRRIEALTAAAAAAWVETQTGLLAEAAAALKTTPAELPARVAGLIEERTRLEREVGELRRNLATGAGAGPGSRDVAGVKFAARRLEDVPPRELKAMADELKRQLGSGVVALVTVTEGKASLVVGVTDDLAGRLSAVDLVRAGSAAVGGKGGGGRPDMAQAGGPDGAKATSALLAIEKALSDRAAAAQ